MASTVVQIKQELLPPIEETEVTISTAATTASSTATAAPITLVTPGGGAAGSAQAVSPQMLFSNAELLQKNIQYINGMVAANNLVTGSGMLTSAAQPTIVTAPGAATSGQVLVVPQPFQQYFTYLRQPAFTGNTTVQAVVPETQAVQDPVSLP